MTACVNNQNENKGGVSHKVLRSVVAGVMAVSMVPSVALADTVAPESEVAPLATEGQTAAFQAGTVTAAIDGNGKALTVDKGVVKIVANGEDQTVVPTVLSLGNGDTIDLTAKDEDGNALYTVTWTGAGSVINGVGEYTAQISGAAGSAYAGLTNSTFKVKVVAASLDGATIFQDNDTAKTAFTYKGEAFDFGFELGDIVLKQGTDYSSVEYYVKETGAKTTSANDGASVEGGAPANAGNYYAKLTGYGVYQGDEVWIPFTINKANLGDIDVEMKDVASSALETNPTTTTFDKLIGTNNLTWINSDGEVKSIAAGELSYQITAGGPFFSGVGSYKVHLAPVKDTDTVSSNFEGSCDVTFNIVTNVATSFTYGSGPGAVDLTASGAKLTFDKAEKEAFDADELHVDSLTSDDYTVTLTKDGVEVKDCTETGKYVLTITVNPGENYTNGGKCVVPVEVYDGNIATGQDVKVYAAFDGAVQNTTISHTYDGTDLAKAVKVTVKDGTKVLKEGTDYELVWTDDNNSDKEVTEVINAGNYTLTVKGITYDSSVAYNVDIAQITPTALRFAGMTTVYTGTDASDYEIGYAYTGAEIVPVVEYTTESASSFYDDVDWKVLPAENYKLSYEKDNESAKLIEAGTYDVTFAENNNLTADNYKLDGIARVWGDAGQDKLKVIDSTAFNDVKAANWYSTAVTAASKKLGYFEGVEGGLFLPAKSLTRAEAIQVLYKMSGATINPDDYAMYRQAAAEFNDVNAFDWYAVQLGWAKTAGLVSGDDQGNFNGGQEINREQFAVMLANYASKFGTYKAADAKVLADYADADSISSWAEDAVAWAVENKVMGANDTLTPQATISRAETATMVVNYQPAKRA